MTPTDDFERSLRRKLADMAPPREPDGLFDAVLSATGHVPQRPALIVGLRSKSFGSTPQTATRLTPLAAAALIAIALLGALVVVGASRLFLTPDPPRVEGVFEPAGTLPVPATKGVLLPDGRVLVFGGATPAINGTGAAANTPEQIIIVDPLTGETRVVGMTAGTVGNVILLADGRVLAMVIGSPAIGGGSQGQIFDPVAESVQATGPSTSGYAAAMARLQDGRVLLVGDSAGSTGAELFDPETGTFVATGSTVDPMRAPTATTLPDGRVLVVGEWQRTAELFDPATGTFERTGSLADLREWFTATALPDGRVLLAGGRLVFGVFEDGLLTVTQPSRFAMTAEIYDPASGTFTASGPMVTPRSLHFAAVTADGRVLIGGGTTSDQADVGSGGIIEPTVRRAESFDPVTDTFEATGDLTVARTAAGAIPLADGTVLILGALGTSPASSEDPAARSMEVYR